MSITRHNWTKEEIIAIYNKPMMDLLYEAASIHREHHDPNVVQVSTLLSIKQVVARKIAVVPTSRKIPHFSGRQRFDVG
jgi:biotin synthase-like enzyme